jgi:azurin
LAAASVKKTVIQRIAFSSQSMFVQSLFTATNSIRMKKITLSIPEPCHEDWNDMTPSQQGRFCGSCQKDVIDFTAMTDDELFRFFATKKSTNVCGRTLIYQLNTPLAKPVEHKKSKFWYISYLTSLLLFFSKSDTKAQVKPQVTTAPVNNQVRLMGKVSRLPVAAEQSAGFVTGKVTDENGNPVPFASIDIKGGLSGVSADVQGNYKIKAKPGDVLTASAAGFESKTIHLTKVSTQNVILSRPERALQGEIMIVAGGISACSSDDYVTPDEPRHIAQLYVKDNGSNAPVANAQLGIVRNNQNRQKSRYTSSQGFYELRNIKESDTYTIMVSANGYKEQLVVINGDDFSKRKMEKIILMEKLDDQKIMEEVVVTTEIKESTTRSTVVPTLDEKVERTVIPDLAPMATLLIMTNVYRPFISKPIKKAQSKAIEVTASVTAYPNPVNLGSNITISTANIAAGDYTLSIMDVLGEKLYNTPVHLSKSSSSFTINTAHVKNPGIYVIEMISESGYKTACKLLVQ